VSARIASLLLAALAGLLAAPAAARADNLEEFAFGPRAQGMGGAFTALASDYTATYYNPGGLILSRHVNLALGYSFADYQLELDSERGGDLDDEAERIPDLSALTIGVSTTIPFDVPDRFGFGLAVFLPTRGLIDIEARAPTPEPDFFRYGESHDRLHLLAALAVKLTDWLSFGAGASIFVDAVGGTTLLPEIEFELKLKPDAGAVVGFLVAPADWISFGVTYRSEISFKLDFPAAALGVPLLELETITFFTPHQVQAGVAINLTPSLLVSVDVAWVNWSAFEDPFLVVSGGVVLRERQDFDDVISPKVGVELAATDWLFLRAGYWYRNSPVPDQDDLGNLVDSPKHVFTVGVGLSFGQPAEQISDEAQEGGEDAETIEEALVDASVDLDFFFQYHLHESRDQTKPATDPIGSWEAGGGIVNFGASLTFRF